MAYATRTLSSRELLSGYRRKINRSFFLLCYFFLTLSLTSCQTRGAVSPNDSFYAALLAESASANDGNGADAFYQAVLNGSPVVREEAARRLLPLLSELPGSARLARLTAAISAPWDRALTLLSGRGGGRDGKDRTEADEELAAVFLSEPVDRLYRWALERAGGTAGSLFTEAEAAAAAGRLSLASQDFSGALGHFRKALETEPGLFLRYPELLTALGRSFQFGDQSGEGTELLLKWEEELRNSGTAAGVKLPAPETSESAETRNGPARRQLAYRFLYFAGRIERQRGRYETAAALFGRAVELAPDGTQADACIWYILSMAFQDKPGEMADLLKIWIPRWSNSGSFDDILDRLARYLVSHRRRETLLEVYRLLKPGAARAQYGYILGRAAESAYLEGAKPEDFSRPEIYFRAVLDEKKASFYYGVLSALKLGTAFPPPGVSASRAAPPEKADGYPHPELMEFLLGFFEHGASKFAVPYITKYRQELSVDELRALAGALQQAGIWDESIRLVQAYMKQDDYEPVRADLELCYPRPFLEPVESYAEEFGIAPWLLFGLIRTESAFATGIGSRAGAVGLTQLMPDTAEDMAGRLARQGGPDYRREGGIDLTDTRTNIHLGAFYLRYLLNHMENPLLALLAYNGGMGRVRRWRTGAPELPADLLVETVEFAETREYVRKVAGAAAVYGFLYYDLTMEAVIADMLE
jgi:soluble lytic murein transglycosylase